MKFRIDATADTTGAGGGAATAPETNTSPGTDVAPGAESDGIFAIPLDDEIDAIVETAAVETVQPPSGAVATPAPAAVSPTPAPAAAPAPTPAPATAPVQAQPQAPAPVQQPQQPQGQVPAYTAEELQAMTPEKFRDELAANRQVLENYYADSLFALSAEESEQLQVNPEKVLPRLMAKLFFEVSAMIPHQLQQFGPRMVQMQIDTTRRHQENENAFFAYWPGMPRDKSAQIVGALNAFKNANPHSTKEQVIQYGGTLACQMLGLDPMAIRNARPIAAAAPASNGNGHAAPAAMQPFRPAGSQVAQIPATQQQPNGGAVDDNPWAGLLAGD